MMKYIFCIIALLVQPLSAWNVYHKQDKRKAALKMPMIYFSGVYLAVQFYVFFKYCMRFPESMEQYSYMIQGAILVVFILIELAMFGSNKYIEDIQQKEQDSIRDFKGLIRNLEICRASVSDMENQKHIDKLIEKMRYSDPVSNQAVARENQRIYELIEELSEITEREAFEKKCSEIAKQLEIRKIKNVKEQG